MQFYFFQKRKFCRKQGDFPHHSLDISRRLPENRICSKGEHHAIKLLMHLPFADVLNGMGFVMLCWVSKGYLPISTPTQSEWIVFNRCFFDCLTSSLTQRQYHANHSPRQGVANRPFSFHSSIMIHISLLCDSAPNIGAFAPSLLIP